MADGPSDAWVKPKKPWPTYPLTSSKRGQVKKYKGKVRYVCPNDTPPDRAVKILADKYKEWDAEPASAVRRKAAPDAEQTVKDLFVRWLDVKHADATAVPPAISWGHYSACKRVATAFLKFVGPATPYVELTPDDFSRFGESQRARLKAKALRRWLRILASCFNHADDEDWIEQPVKFGQRFRKLANAKDNAVPIDKSREPAEFQKIVAGVEARIRRMRKERERDLRSAEQLRAGIWLAVNGGYGGADLGGLPVDVVDLDGAVIDYRRGKTKMERVVPLMPEAVAALRPVLAAAVDRGDELVFRTREGQPWYREIPKLGKGNAVVSTTTIDNFQQTYAKLLRTLGLKRAGCGFYELRHTHAELADAAGDPHAASRIMGHALPGSKDPYIRVTAERLRKVVDFVRAHLVSKPVQRSGTSAK